MTAYYNEIDPYAAQWLRNLISGDLIAPGDVDERSIVDVQPNDLRGYTQCHFFAGIGVWSHALRLAGWDDSRSVWTGSCPCQPFSVAGKGAGTSDERHLWPHWFRLIQELRPDVVFGEQVEAAIRHGWLDAVQADMEGIGYAVGAVGLPAAGFGAPHIRQRLWFVAESDSRERNRMAGALPAGRPERWAGAGNGQTAGSGGAGTLAHACSQRSSQQRGERIEPPRSAAASFWSDADWIACRDGKARPTQPGTFPLAHGIAGRVGRLRAYGNAIVAPVAQAFIESYIDSAASPDEQKGWET